MQGCELWHFATYLVSSSGYHREPKLPTLQSSVEGTHPGPESTIYTICGKHLIHGNVHAWVRGRVVRFLPSELQDFTIQTDQIVPGLTQY
jgi:hypothetical protein